MTLIIRDILYGNPRLDEMGWHEEALGRNAVVGGFQGQRQWTDWLPNADFTEALTGMARKPRPRSLQRTIPATALP